MRTAPQGHATRVPASGHRVPRRAALGALAAPIAGLPATGHAQTAGTDWPSQPVRYINPFPPGGATDTLSRLYCAKMSEIAGQQFVVENRSGSGGNVGVDAVAKSRPDGYTIGLGGIASHALALTLYATPGWPSTRRATSPSSPASGACRTSWW